MDRRGDDRGGERLPPEDWAGDHNRLDREFRFEGRRSADFSGRRSEGLSNLGERIGVLLWRGEGGR